ncbi:MAG: hypothetical protein IJZ00_10290 [Lachnospiraceae bacterium]|nr:hypothetical protein [Lachnospiraceae bacterium]
MQTIIIVLDSEKMTNPDLDIRYVLPDRIEEYTNQLVQDNGYDYLENDELALWLETEDAAQYADKIVALLNAETILENDLTLAADIYISEEANAELEQCRKVYPV